MELLDNEKEKSIPFYEKGYISKRDRTIKENVDVSNPRDIYEYLKCNVFKQDDYCKNAAMILYNHIRGITSRNLVCGPSGCGKTYLWQCLKKIWPQIIFVDSSTLTKTGWKGNNNVSDFLSRIDFQKPKYIIVFDEFDKCVSPQITSEGQNVSKDIQAEFLKLIEGETVPVKIDKTEITIDTSGMSFVFCGSFAEKARDISKDNTNIGLGFGAEKYEEKPFEKELAINDVIDFGLIPELASRITRIVNTRPLIYEDYRYLIIDHPASPLKKIEELYGMKMTLSKTKIDEVARKAYNSGLGIRNVASQLQQIMDEDIFDSFLKEETYAH